MVLSVDIPATVVNQQLPLYTVVCGIRDWRRPQPGMVPNCHNPIQIDHSYVILSDFDLLLDILFIIMATSPVSVLCATAGDAFNSCDVSKIQGLGRVLRAYVGDLARHDWFCGEGGVWAQSLEVTMEQYAKR